ncbi:MAG TPA: YIP1 family protein [Syntrophaceticus sp.]|nr:YIP1 family protein [Syntrophaceticus sp.]
MWERIIGVIMSPRETLRQTAEGELWKEGLLIILLTSVLKWLSQLAAPEQKLLGQLERLTGSPLQQYSTPLDSPIAAFFSSLSGDLISWALGGLLFFLFAKLFKGQGTIPGMLAGLGYASTPFFLGAPLMAVTSGGIAGYLLRSAIGFATAIWVAVLQIIAIRESQQISTGGAIVTFIIPGILLLLVLVFFILLITALILMAA